MTKQRFQYGISGYRWAPESFCVLKGLPGKPKKAVPLAEAERSEVANQFLRYGFHPAVAYIKHLERQREHRSKRYVTYGFTTREQSRLFVYSPQLYCCADAPIQERLRVFKLVRKHLKHNNGEVETSTECELDGVYRPINVRKNVVTADFDRPIRIWLKDAA